MFRSKSKYVQVISHTLFDATVTVQRTLLPVNLWVRFQRKMRSIKRDIYADINDVQ